MNQLRNNSWLFSFLAIILASIFGNLLELQAQEDTNQSQRTKRQLPVRTKPSPDSKPKSSRNDSLPKVKADVAIDTSLAKQANLDSLAIAIADSLKKDTILTDDHPKQALKWAMIPGGGQIYNHQIPKAPVYVGAMVGFGTWAIAENQAYKNQDATFNALLANVNQGETVDLIALEDIRLQKEATLKRYNYALYGTMASYGFSMVDAYVQGRLQIQNQEGNFTHSPLKAAYRSATLPGWGQAYNGKYWKIPIVYAGFGAIGYFMIDNWQERQFFKNEYLARNRPGYGEPNSAFANYDDEAILTIKALYDRYFQIAIIAGTLWYGVNIIDAVIDAHLHEFDVSDDLSFQAKPFIRSLASFSSSNTLVNGTTGGLQLTISF